MIHREAKMVKPGKYFAVKAVCTCGWESGYGTPVAARKQLNQHVTKETSHARQD